MSTIASRLLSRTRLSFPLVRKISSLQNIQKCMPLTSTNASCSKMILFNVPKLSYSTDNKELKAKFDALVKDKNIVVFMKGIFEIEVNY